MVWVIITSDIREDIRQIIIGEEQTQTHLFNVKYNDEVVFFNKRSETSRCFKHGIVAPFNIENIKHIVLYDMILIVIVKFSIYKRILDYYLIDLKKNIGYNLGSHAITFRLFRLVGYNSKIYTLITETETSFEDSLYCNRDNDPLWNVDAAIYSILSDVYFGSQILIHIIQT